jgi:hypothetical protein
MRPFEVFELENPNLKVGFYGAFQSVVGVCFFQVVEVLFEFSLEHKIGKACDFIELLRMGKEGLDLQRCISLEGSEGNQVKNINVVLLDGIVNGRISVIVGEVGNRCEK